MINMRVAGYGKVVSPSRKSLAAASPDATIHVKGTRDVYFERENGFVSTTIYDGDQMQAGNKIEGPAIIEQKTTTVVVPPNATIEISSFGDYLLTLRA
mgnify:CR=1 FL=1